MGSSIINIASFRPMITKAVQYLGEIGRGASKPHLIRCLPWDFIVKFKESSHGVRALIAELVCAILSIHLSIPTPLPALVQVSPDFLQSNANALSGYSSGLHYGSQWLGDLAPHQNTVADLAFVSNQKDLAKLNKLR